MPVPKILVVDDDSAISDIFRSMLLAAGHSDVEAVQSGKEAIRRFEDASWPPDLVLMDERMVGKSGLEATREILARWPRTRILMVSADASVQFRWEGAGAWGFVEKPVTWDDLQRAVDLTLRGAQVNVASDDGTAQDPH